MRILEKNQPRFLLAFVAGSCLLFAACDDIGTRAPVPVSLSPQQPEKTGEMTTCWFPSELEQLGLSARVNDISAGGGFTCAVVNKKVICWGNNYSGQFGDRSTHSSSKPVLIEDLFEDDFKSVTAGDAHMCALRTDGVVLCSGYNKYGQLGNGSQTHSNRPKPILGIPGKVVEVHAGTRQTCARNEAGEVYCWGDNEYSQLGNSTKGKQISFSVELTSDSDSVKATRLAVGGFHGCLIAQDHTVWCWGNNGSGQLGTDPSGLESSADPVQVNGLEATEIVAGSNFTCVITLEKTVACFGSHVDGTVNFDHEPTHVAGLKNVKFLSAGKNRVCAGNESGEAYCWGLGWAQDHSAVPEKLRGLDGKVKSIAIGEDHQCMVTFKKGVVREFISCLGGNKSGELGNGKSSSHPRLKPSRVFGF